MGATRAPLSTRREGNIEVGHVRIILHIKVTERNGVGHVVSINEINATRFALIQATDPQWWFLLSSYFAPGRDGSKSGARIMELVDQSGDSYYYQLLRLAQGTGQLRDDVDIQLMSHTLYCIANSAGERLIFAEANFDALQQVLAQQSAQVVTPYLNEAA